MSEAGKKDEDEEGGELIFSSTESNEEFCSDSDSDGSIEFEHEKKEDGIFKVISSNEVAKMRRSKIQRISSNLKIPYAICSQLLLKYNWDESLVEENHSSSDGEDIQPLIRCLGKSIKLCEKIKCKDCCNKKELSSFLSLSCSHFRCDSCWEKYLHGCVNDNESCLFQTCPECQLPLNEYHWKNLSNPSDYEFYKNFLQKSFIENNPSIKCCPRPECNYVIQKTTDSRKPSVDIAHCDCHQLFCFNCCSGPHEPAKCIDLAKWKQYKDRFGNEATQIEKSHYKDGQHVIEGTKTCPCCKEVITVSVHSTQAFVNISCPKCKNIFCWFCLKTTHRYSHICTWLEEWRESMKTEEGRKEEKKRKLFINTYRRFIKLNKLTKMKTKDHENAILKKSEDSHYCIQDAFKIICDCQRLLKYSYIRIFCENLEVEDNESSPSELLEFAVSEVEKVLESLIGELESGKSILPIGPILMLHDELSLKMKNLII